MHRFAICLSARRAHLRLRLLIAACLLASTPAYAQVITSLSIGPSTDVSLPQGPAVQLRATAVFSDGVTRDVTMDASWSVSDPTVLALGTTPGVVQGVAAGIATVTAAHSGFTTTASYTVNPPALTFSCCTEEVTAPLSSSCRAA